MSPALQFPANVKRLMTWRVVWPAHAPRKRARLELSPSQRREQSIT